MTRENRNEILGYAAQKILPPNGYIAQEILSSGGYTAQKILSSTALDKTPVK